MYAIRRIVRLEQRFLRPSGSETPFVDVPPRPVLVEEWERQVGEYREAAKRVAAGQAHGVRCADPPATIAEWCLLRCGDNAWTKPYKI